MCSKLNFIRIMIILLFVIPCYTHAQESEDTLKLTMEEALNKALEYNTDIRNARLDVKIADKKVWETTAQGLPQISGSSSYNNNLSLATQLFPNFIEPTIMQILMEQGVIDQQPIPEPEKIEVQFGSQHTFGANVEVSQLVFSGPYIVGLQASKVYKSLAKEQEDMTELNVKANIMNTYHSILLTRENLEILRGNLENLYKTLKDTKVMHENGFAEETDVDQIQINVTSLENNLKSTERQMESLKNLLKVQMGIDLNVPVELTQSLDYIIAEENLEPTYGNEFNPRENVNYQLTQTEVELSELDLKREKSNYLPSISAFYSYSQDAMRDEFNVFDFDEPWYESSVLGFQLNIPIFSSFERRSKVQQAELNLEKSKNKLENTRKTMKNNFIQARNNYLTALESHESNEKNKELAKKVYNQTTKKYKEGMATSMELTQANDKYLQMESAYINSLVELLEAKVELEKILNEL
ncbi:MAG: TolC family protein [Bacteroidales bacterium]